MEYIKQMIDRLDQHAKKVPQLVQLSEKTGLTPGQIAFGILSFISLIILVTMGATILTVIITVVYPAFKSIQALETKGDDEDDKIWLTYWVVFGTFTLLDEFGSVVLQFIPFYFYIKLGFFVWMMLPQTKGSKIVYENVLRPMLLKNKDKIEKFIAEVKGGASSVLDEAKKEAMT